MARKPLIGHLPNCPTCGLEQMEVRLDKNNAPYAFCEDCNQQLLTHGGRKGKLMLDRMTPVVRYQVDAEGRVEILPDEPEPKPEKTPVADPVPEPKPEPEPKPKPKKEGGLLL